MSSNNERTVALGNRLKELRNKHNLTITGLAEVLGISHSYVGFLEKGTRKV
ncbi:helix-turn-helix protein [Ureibacillus xyleni]|uniref:Helix-turn-helix protein n=1 Tax=Ureibacillus xyleni TaxID=614648 RepID=A0A285R918_9BACL|nr:helix-turn-helix transcriptional regulator [Ureibacillus xyleni]SOB90595.1 helix-turn-helix protein [Ureibacillus xyleni]